MSVFDYTKKLILFSPYELNVIQMIIQELELKKMDMFKFLNEIDLNEVEFFWYKDSSEDNLGGFYFLSRNAIYINHCGMKDQVDENDYYNLMNHIIIVFGTIMHELCHYWQCKKNPLLYFVLQFPVLRDYTIEKQAYEISDYLKNNNKFNNLGFIELIKMKQKYHFSENYFSEKQKKILNKQEEEK